MMNDPYTVFVGDDEWRIGCVHANEVRVDHVPFGDQAALEARIDAVRQQLADAGYAGQPIVLALASSWCLCAMVSTDDLERGGRRRAMGFRLEEHLPVSAEEFVADYVDAGNDASLGVCSELDKLRTLINAFESAGIAVRHICPAVFLAAAHAVEQHADVGGVLIGTGNGDDASRTDYDLIELRKGRPARWWWFAEDGPAVREQLAAWTTPHEHPLRLAVIGSDEATRSGTHEDESLLQRIGFNGTNCDQAAVHHASRILQESASPWIDLRRDTLAAPDRLAAYRKPVGMLAAAVVALLVCVSAVAQWRGRQYESLDRQYVQQQTDVFKAALPDQRVPINIKARMLSEHRKLAGLVGQTTDDPDAGVTESTSALLHLRNVLSSLPKTPGYRILDLSIEPELTRIDGEARSYADAERVAVSLRQSGMYEIELPKTQALREGGVSFLFTARPTATDAPATNGGRP